MENAVGKMPENTPICWKQYRHMAPPGLIIGGIAYIILFVSLSLVFQFVFEVSVLDGIVALVTFDMEAIEKMFEGEMASAIGGGMILITVSVMSGSVPLIAIILLVWIIVLSNDNSKK